MPPWQTKTIPTSFLSIPPLFCCRDFLPALLPWHSDSHIFHSACPCPGLFCPSSATAPLPHSIPLLRHHLQILCQVLWPNRVSYFQFPFSLAPQRFPSAICPQE